MNIECKCNQIQFANSVANELSSTTMINLHEFCNDIDLEKFPRSIRRNKWWNKCEKLLNQEVQITFKIDISGLRNRKTGVI